MFERIGHFSYRYRWAVLTLWLLAVVAALPFLPRVSGALEVGGFSSPHTEAARTRELLRERIPRYSPSSLIVLFSHPSLHPSDPSFVEQAQQALRNVTSVPHVTGIRWFTENPSQVAPDGSLAYAVIDLDLQPEEAQRVLDEIQAAIVPTELRVQLAGAPAFYADLERVTERDLRRAELIAFPFALAALLFVFGSVIAAAVPLFIGGVTVALVLGLVYALTRVTELSIFTLNVATLLGLGLSIDYSLFLVSRFREELAANELEQAVARTTATAGRAVFFSGLTVLIGLSGLGFFEFLFMRSVGIAGILVVLVAVSASLTLLPALLGILGRWVDALQVIRRGPETGRFWHGITEFVMQRPLQVAIPVIVVLVLLGLPFRHVKLSSPDATILPTSTPSRQALDEFRRAFGDGALSPIIIAIETERPVNDPQTLAALYEFTRRLAADPRVTSITSLVTIDPRITLAQYQMLYVDPTQIPDPVLRRAYEQLAGDHLAAVYVYTDSLPASDRAKQLLHDIRRMDPGPGLRLWVDGGTAEIVDVVDRMYSEFPYAALTVVLATYVVLFLLLRSVFLPLKAIILNVLSLTASYGALVFVFQDGHFSSLLRFSPLGFTEASLPIVMFCILFGVSMDYEVFLLSRMREAWDQTRDNRIAVATGLARSGRIITGAALILVVVATAFVTADVVLIKALGLGIALAIALDASIVRTLLVPATMRLLGQWNWWVPRRMARTLEIVRMEH
ncbi:MMPL family transporter [Thermomicrobium sp. CFH 73360]|uniref:MMPL family transporter n=1 Tax=Thermomicrobium sp. CFH 73360 TaxID=2951987 RepID=UPI002076A1AD|nr:MMPL family transporter [Thermomicrobium sp. CFH 73360]MCM8745616.1 MMPL family transporter [Thermomicrobium sp. CFH 73360]